MLRFHRLAVPAVVAALGLMTFAATTARAGWRGGPPPVKPGVEVLLGEPDFFSLVKGKRVGLITNPTGVDHLMRSTVDLLHQNPDVTLTALFGPEHGVRGDAYAGDKVEDTIDPTTGVPVFSLYGSKEKRRPSAEALDLCDVLVYDIQDVGSRSYTYIYTMAYCMEAAAERGMPFLVLDRPNPAGGHIVDGNILDPAEHTTFVGMYPIAYQYGMTPGETAAYFNGEFLEKPCDLHVVPMRGYKRNMFQEDTGLPFVPTSTHIARADASTFYNLTGIIGEIRHVSIGVGYTLPFEVFGAPWIDRDELCAAMTAEHIPGLLFRPVSFKPRYGAYVDEMCQGVQLHIVDFDALRPVTAQMTMMEVFQRLYPDNTPFADEHAEKTLFDEVLGTDSIRARILAGDKAADIVASYQPAVAEFMKTRAKYLMYE